MKIPRIFIHLILAVILPALSATAQLQDCDGDGIDDRDQLVDTFSYSPQYDTDSAANYPSDTVEGNIAYDGFTETIPAKRLPPVLSDVTLYFGDEFDFWVSTDPADPDQNLLIYLNGTFVGRVFDGINDDTFVIPQATWNSLVNGVDDFEIILELSTAAAVAADFDLIDFLSDVGCELELSYLFDRDVNDNGWLDDCVPDGDPSGPDSDGDGVSDSIDRSPNTIADPSLVDAHGNLLRVARFDADEDGDVDVTDFDLLDASVRDVDGDGDSDLHDLVSILHAARGPGVAADPAFLQELSLFKAHTLTPDDIPLWSKSVNGNDLFSYHYAMAYCEAMYGTHLATIDQEMTTTSLTPEEQVAHLHEIMAASGSSMNWIGLRYQDVHSAFVWENGQIIDAVMVEDELQLWENDLGNKLPGSGFFTPGQDDFYVVVYDKRGFGNVANFRWTNLDGLTPTYNSKALEGFIAQLPQNTVPASPVTTTETVTVTIGSSLAGQTVAPGQTIDWTISFQVSSGDNSGLALLVTDLTQDAGNRATLDLPAGHAVPSAMQNFGLPLGFTGPGGYGGQQVGTPGALNLAEIGGAQNTFGGASSDTAHGQGTTVVSGIGQSGNTILATGSFTAPAAVGTYTFNLANTLASVLKTVGGPGQGSEIVPANISVAQGSFSIKVSNPPVITLLGNNPVTHEAATPYADAGATAIDAEDGDLSGSIIVNNSVNVNVPGNYTVTYTATDSDGDVGTATRTVQVIDTTAPAISLLGGASLTHEAGTPYNDAGATAFDTLDGDLTSAIAVDNPVNPNVPGSYTVTYNVTDASGNAAAPVTRTVNVVDTTPPVITLLGTDPVTIEHGDTYSDAGATALDSFEGNLTDLIVVSGSVDNLVPGIYVLTYHVADGSGNSATPATRTVLVDGNDTPTFEEAIVSILVDEATTGMIYLAVADDEEDAVLGYSLGAAGDEAFFAIDTITGELSLTSVLHFETPGDADGDNVYRVEVIATDTEGLSTSQIVEVAINNTNIGPVITGTLLEPVEEVNSYYVYDFRVADDQPSDLTFQVTDNRFTVSEDGEGGYRVHRYAWHHFDYEKLQDYDFDLIVSDGVEEDSVHIAFSLVNINDNAPVVSFASAGPVTENDPSVVLGVFSITDPDGDENFSFFDLGDIRFEIAADGRTLKLKDGVALDYETQTSLYVGVIVSDGLNEGIHESYIEILDVNDVAPHTIELSGLVVTENDTGAVVGTLSAVDEDGPSLAFAVSDARFTVVSDVLKLADGVALDREATPTLTLTVTASDGTLESSQEFNITVLNIDEGAPENIALSHASIDENTTGIIGQLSASDVDGDDITFSIADGRFLVSGDTLELIKALNFEKIAGGTLALAVTASGGGASTTETLLITVQDVNEAPKLGLTLGTAGSGLTGKWNLPVLENIQQATAALSADPSETRHPLSFEANDEDGDSLTYVLTGADAAAFTVDAETGALLFVDIPDFEIPGDANGDGVYEVIVTVMDGEFSSNAITLKLNILDVFEDITPPVITLIGEATLSHEAGTPYSDAGATAADEVDGDLTASIETVDTVDANVAGSYTVTYSVSDAAGNTATELRMVNVVDTTSPVITLVGSASVTHEAGAPYLDEGATALDSLDGDLTLEIVTLDPVNTMVPGLYTVTYNVMDTAGNTAVEVTRSVQVVDTTAPVITLLGDVSVLHEAGQTYVEAGATASDTLDGDLTSQLLINNEVDEDTPGTYHVTFDVSDAAGNAATPVVRTVEVVDTTAPTFSEFPNDVVLYCDDPTSTDVTGAAVAQDNSDGTLTVTTSDVALGGCPGVIERTWRAVDPSNNSATAVQRIHRVPAVLITDVSGGIFDMNPETLEREFRTVFTLDIASGKALKLQSTNPGQYKLHAFYLGTPGEQVEVALRLPIPFVTKGDIPVVLHDGVEILFDELGMPYVSSGAVAGSLSEVITLDDYSETGVYDLAIEITVPESGVADLAIALEYGLKGTTGYTRNSEDDATDDQGVILVPNFTSYTFEATTSQYAASDNVHSINEFKTNPGVGGLVQWEDETPVVGLTVVLVDPSGVIVNQAVTDNDGYYQIVYKHKGKPAGYQVGLILANGTYHQAVELKGNTFAEVNFVILED